jgi:hypothetical protein
MGGMFTILKVGDDPTVGSAPMDVRRVNSRFAAREFSHTHPRTSFFAENSRKEPRFAPNGSRTF